ncbi:MAG: leucine-rich repeat domain-containing protein [Bacteroidia bacterium]
MRFYTSIFILMVLLAPLAGRAQISDADSLRRQQMARYVEDARSLVDFTAYMLNVLGDPQASVSEKDEIIRFSFRKAFRDNDVQIEDDLVKDRNNITQKDVQGYLKDVDFFYKSVDFRFEIEGLTNGVTESGKPFFLLHTMRHLNGVTQDGDTVRSILPRYFEVNVDEVEQVAYIVSIYTHSIGEEEALTSWWNSLTAEWKAFFGERIEIAPGLQLKPLLADKPGVQVGDSLWVPISLWKTDSTEGEGSWLTLGSDQFFFSLRAILSQDSLDLSYQTKLVPLDPLSRFDQLVYLNLSHTQIVDLSPIRNLVKLQSLDCSYTGVQHFDPLRYLDELRTLRASHSRLKDLGALKAFQKLTALEIHHTPVSDISPLSKLRNLVDLDLSNTRVSDLAGLRALPDLKTLKLSFCPVSDLTPLAQIPALQILYIDHTAIAEAGALATASELQTLLANFSKLSSLEGLGRAPKLTRIEANGTPLSRESAIRFMRLYPGKMVIFQTVALTRWWEGLSPEWQGFFRKQQAIEAAPSPEQLHTLINTDSLVLPQEPSLARLEPLSEFIGLRSLHAQGLPITSLAPLRNLLELEDLNLSSTPLNTIAALSGMPRLQNLNLAYTRVGDLGALRGQGALRRLDIRGTLVGNLEPLHEALALELVLADSTSIGIPEARAMLKARPSCLVVFQTPVLSIWWKSLSDAWQNALLDEVTMPVKDSPASLHRMAQLSRLNLIDRTGISKLGPLRQLWNLKELRMINTRVEQLEPLSICTGLEVLVCSSGPVVDLTPLINLRKLRILDCENTPVESLEPLATIVSLQDLRVSGTQIKDLKALEGLINLRSLSCNNTRVRSLKPIENLKQFRYISCYNTKIHPSRISEFKASHPEVEVVYY